MVCAGFSWRSRFHHSLFEASQGCGCVCSVKNGTQRAGNQQDKWFGGGLQSSQDLHQRPTITVLKVGLCWAGWVYCVRRSSLSLQRQDHVTRGREAYFAILSQYFRYGARLTAPSSPPSPDFRAKTKLHPFVARRQMVCNKQDYDNVGCRARILVWNAVAKETQRAATHTTQPTSLLPPNPFQIMTE